MFQEQFAGELVCRICLTESRFLKTQDHKHSRQRWEDSAGDKRRTDERRIERRRESKEKFESHMAAMIPACVHLYPNQTTRLASRERVCVWLTSLGFGQQAHTSGCVLQCNHYVCVGVCVREHSQQGWKHMGWRAHAAKHIFSHKTVSQQRFFPEAVSDLCR